MPLAYSGTNKIKPQHADKKSGLMYIGGFSKKYKKYPPEYGINVIINAENRNIRERSLLRELSNSLSEVRALLSFSA